MELQTIVKLVIAAMQTRGIELSNVDPDSIVHDIQNQWETGAAESRKRLYVIQYTRTPTRFNSPEFLETDDICRYLRRHPKGGISDYAPFEWADSSEIRRLNLGNRMVIDKIYTIEGEHRLFYYIRPEAGTGQRHLSAEFWESIPLNRTDQMAP